jgi:hypothetical protein
MSRISLRLKARVVAVGVLSVGLALAPAAVASASQEQTLSGNDTVTGDVFGWSVSISGTSAIVSAHGHDGNTGSAYVFTKVGSKWKQQAKLRGLDTVAGDSFGYAVAISGNVAVVGAPNHNGAGIGAAYIFTRTGTKWTQRHEVSGAYVIGKVVAVSGTTVLISAQVGDGRSAVLVYVETGTKWTFQRMLESGLTGDDYGQSVGVSGNLAVVGASYDGAAIGHAYIYSRTGTHWYLRGKVTGKDTIAEDNFGYSVAVDGNVIVAGAPFRTSGKGAVYAFVPSGTHWVQQAELHQTSASTGDEFGWSVAASGTWIVGGAPMVHNSGAAFSFSRTGTSWHLRHKLAATDTGNGDNLGWYVGVSGTTAVVGAPTKAADKGSAYVFAT